MERSVATLPESVEELCLVRLGLMVRRWSAWPYTLGLIRAIGRATEEAARGGSGLLGSERMIVGLGHFVLLQYWSSFEALEAWSHRPPHSEWWKGAAERMRTRTDFGIYHETYLVPRGGVESIYLNTPPVGPLRVRADRARRGPDDDQPRPARSAGESALIRGFRETKPRGTTIDGALGRPERRERRRGRGPRRRLRAGPRRGL